MKNIIKYSIACALTLSMSACKKDWLDRQSQTLLVNEQVMNDPKLIVGLLANFYDRLPTDASLTSRWQQHTSYDDAVWSGGGNAGDEERNNIVQYATDRWRIYDYALIRDINLAIENMNAVGNRLTADQKLQFEAEFRFLRAYNYFEMVKRMGGVPIITTQLLIDDKGDVAGLRKPRNKEAEVYDFIASEIDAIKDVIGNTGSPTRANKYTALALKSRAMLYAGSLAKYNNQLPSPITLPGGEVGIPANRAADYYQKSLDASKEIINSGRYSLYNGNPNLGENFFEAITKKVGNPEVIFAQDFLQTKGRNHAFSYDNIARSIREDNLGSSAIAPTLNLVETYDFLNGDAGTLRNRTADNSDYIYYDNISDIFANKDARLYGTVIYPGTSFKGSPVQIQAGVMVWNAATNSYQTVEGNLGSIYGPPTFPNGDGGLLTGASGPQRSAQDVSNTGFYLRKYVDPAPQSSNRGRQSDMWWVRFRLGEIYLNAAEAAFELGNTPEALTYVNTLRKRAGFPDNSLTTLSIDKLISERRAELAFEDHRLWDLIRTRKATEVWNGSTTSTTANLYALYPYRIVRPGDAARHNKYVFVKLVAPRFRTPRFFQIQNYYMSIPQNAIDANPLIVRNPFH
ncbi:RagB/SusD family nutrient uptake outer membrane protein [Paracnuella aquatica]|uniref:RagB/SusD family nutrient uptake outer membrane protein n=1 Tax=Paracnuella aquatica TaxID=2268757 RepID=UPI000DEFEAF3|nr:RagB/SusD family nutrient uptake outer membrane protein [Paracnuella aquatica]RPD51320.1 RagB/SusD family nutrient uptake outer membrane protein [Paracnuella aquatica]